ncbi:MAG: hypothetical protein IPI73_18285 [Betaproteobacteria bacterium]|nr:hypothetical protein [Betaproteobacteria bacterium]
MAGAVGADGEAHRLGRAVDAARRRAHRPPRAVEQRLADHPARPARGIRCRLAPAPRQRAGSRLAQRLAGKRVAQRALTRDEQRPAQRRRGEGGSLAPLAAVGDEGHSLRRGGGHGAGRLGRRWRHGHRRERRGGGRGRGRRNDDSQPERGGHQGSIIHGSLLARFKYAELRG